MQNIYSVCIQSVYSVNIQNITPFFRAICSTPRLVVLTCVVVSTKSSNRVGQITDKHGHPTQEVHSLFLVHSVITDKQGHSTQQDRINGN